MAELSFMDNCIMWDTGEKIESYYATQKMKTLYVLGQGFDPRMCDGIAQINSSIEELDILLVVYKERTHSSSERYKDLVNNNFDTLKSFERSIKTFDIPSNSNLPLLIKGMFCIAELEKVYKRIVVDISAMPQSIFFNIVQYLLIEIEKTNSIINLDVVICENSELDDAIVPTGLSETAKSLSGFKMFSSDLESDENPIPIWIPLLGKGCAEELEKLYSYISPQEICPVLPFPSKDPRRSDEILSILGRQLFEAFSVETRNIIYVAEQNVLDVYTKLYKSIVYYDKVLKIIGDPKFFISLGTSKLISFGALLSNLSLRKQDIVTTFAIVENSGYTFDKSKYNPDDNRICCLSLNKNIYGW